MTAAESSCYTLINYPIENESVTEAKLKEDLGKYGRRSRLMNGPKFLGLKNSSAKDIQFNQDGAWTLSGLETISISQV